MTAIAEPISSTLPEPGPMGRDDRRRRSAMAFKLFLRLTERWGLSGQEQRLLLGDVPRATFQRWKAKLPGGEGIELSRDQMERVSLALGIEKGLKLVFAEDAAGLRWLKAPNADVPFGGQPPLALMLGGGIVAMHRVRCYLDGWRGVR